VHSLLPAGIHIILSYQIFWKITSRRVSKPNKKENFLWKRFFLLSVKIPTAISFSYNNEPEYNDASSLSDGAWETIGSLKNYRPKPMFS